MRLRGMITMPVWCVVALWVTALLSLAFSIWTTLRVESMRDELRPAWSIPKELD